MEEVTLSSHQAAENISSTAANTFDQTWCSTDIATLDDSNLPLPKVRRAWERVPQSPREKDARYRKVWRRYGMHLQPEAGLSEDDETKGSNGQNTDSRERAIKRQCLNDFTVSTDVANEREVIAQYAGTKYDRRKSGYIRKTRAPETRLLLNDNFEEPGTKQNAQIKESNSPGKLHSATAQNVVRRENQDESRPSTAIRKRKPLGRYSLGSKAFNRRLSSLSPQKSLDTDNKLGQVDALCLSSRKKAPIPSMPVLQEDVEPAARTEHAAVSSTPSVQPDQSMASREIGSPIVAETCSPTSKGAIADSNSETREGNEAVPSDNSPASDMDGLTEDETHVKNNTDLVLQGEGDGEEETVQLHPPSALTDAIFSFSEDTTHLELDTALLKDFLSRTAAAKASKPTPDGPDLSVGRRSSLMNRRDSDAIRHALASPRKPLDDKDPNSALAESTSKPLDMSGMKELAVQLSPTLVDTVNSMDMESTSTDVLTSSVSSTGTRRSARNRSRLPAPSAATAPEKTPSKTISVKQAADGSDPTTVVIKKTEAQELSILTRANTRRNKGSSTQRRTRLKSLRKEGMAPAWEEGNVKDMPAINASENVIDGEDGESDGSDEDQEPWKIPAEGEKGVRWKPKEQLIVFLGTSFTPEASTSDNAVVAEDTLTRIPAPSSLTALSAAVVQAQTNVDSPTKTKSKPARMRRLRGLGAANGTPAKGLLSSKLLPDEVAEEMKKEKEQTKMKTRLPSAREKKSRLATPKKLTLAPMTVDNGIGGTGDPVVNVETRCGMETRARRLASPKKISQFKVAPISGGRGRKKA